MNISNATAAGPSYGLFDVIFGTKPKENAKAGGDENNPLMNLLKALKEKSQEGESRSRTDEEIAPGKGKAERNAVGIPGWYPHQVVTEPAAAGAERGAAAAAPAAAAAQGGMKHQAVQAAGGKPLGPDPAEVNRLLKERSLPPLTAEESKLLQDVNAKAGAKLEGNSLSNEAVQKMTGLKAAAVPAGAGGVAAKMQQNAVSAETAVAQEKFFPTDAYLQMHESFAKKPMGEESLKTRVQDEPGPMSSQQRSQLSVEGGERFEQKGGDLFGGHQKPVFDLKKADSGEMRPGSESTLFAGGLASAIGKSQGEIVRDIMLPGVKPEEMRDPLLREVNQSVGYQAVKGGGEMKLVIHPEQLGEVKLKISAKGGEVEVQITAQNEEVAKAIRSGSKELESSLREQSLALSKFDVAVANDAPVASADSKGNLADQFLQQNQNGFNGFGGQEASERWSGQGERDGSGFGVMAEEDGSRASSPNASQKNPVRDSSRRLDVVA